MLRIIIAQSKINKLSNIHPLEKLILALGPIIIGGFAKSPLPLILNIIVFIGIHIFCKNPIRIVIKFILATAFFSAVSCLTFVFDYGIPYCITILLKAISGGIVLGFLAITTPLDDILYFGAKSTYLRDVCDIAKCMERFLILIEDELYMLNNSIKSRCGFDTFNLKVKNTGKMAGLLFINTMKRWAEIKDGINSRCYKGYMPYMEKEFDLSFVRLFIILAYNLGLVFII